jgi:hypothetical protein
MPRRTLDDAVSDVLKGLEEGGDIVDAVRDSGELQGLVDESLQTDRVKTAIIERVEADVKDQDNDAITEAISDVLDQDRYRDLIGDLLDSDDQVRKAVRAAVQSVLTDPQKVANAISEDDVREAFESIDFADRIKELLASDPDVKAKVDERVKDILADPEDYDLFSNDDPILEAVRETIGEVVKTSEKVKDAIAAAVEERISEQGYFDDEIDNQLGDMDISEILKEVVETDRVKALIRARADEVVTKQVDDVQLDGKRLQVALEDKVTAAVLEHPQFQQKIAQRVDVIIRRGDLDEMIDAQVAKMFSADSGKDHVGELIRQVASQVISQLIIDNLKRGRI